MIVDIRRLSDQVADINRQLTGSELGGKEFDEFTKQEDILKVGISATPDRGQSKMLLTIEERGSKMVRNSVLDCHLPP